MASTTSPSFPATAAAADVSSSNDDNASKILAGLRLSLGDGVVKRIQREARILLVGAGGIGCELLKNLALSGFTKVDVVDLDTVDVSNLNRQLLFRAQHVGMPKCTVACQVASQMAISGGGNSNDNEEEELDRVVRYVPHHGNVCEPKFFGVSFVSQFDLILSALDNVAARRRVNRIALAAGVPLVEAGTTGYLGQANVIDGRSSVACYECKTQEKQKEYPICTIRSTPSAPVHTIVWAKELYALLFGDKVEASMLYEDPNGEEPTTFMDAVLKYRALLVASSSSDDDDDDDDQAEAAAEARTAATELLHVFYVAEIQKQLDMDRYKTAMKTPVVLGRDVVDAGSGEDKIDGATATAPSKKPGANQNDLWSAEECAAEFVACLVGAAARKKQKPALPSFDKDDPLAMSFVTAASNLRNYVFGIEPIQSLYSAKGIAGNIIPAIATTNAIVAGLQVLQAFRILSKQLETGNKAGGLAECCHYLNCIRNPTRNGLYLTASTLEPPNPKCFVCQTSKSVPVALNLDNWTLKDFIDKVLKKDLGFEEPSVLIEDSGIWEEGEDADPSFVRNLAKPLKDLPGGGIVDGSLVLVEDFTQDLTVELAVTHRDTFEKEDGETDEEENKFKFVIGGTKPTASKPVANDSAGKENGGNEKIAEANGDKKGNDADDDDDSVIEVIEENGDKKADVEEIVENGGSADHAGDQDKKRPAVEVNGDDADGPPAKKSKMDSDVAEVIEIDEN